MLNRRNILSALIVAILALVVNCGRGGPVLRTYSISGDITLVNDCSGNGGDNPANIDITVRLWYTSDTVNAALRKVETVAMVLQADGVTSQGTYTVSDVPTNETGQRWEIEFPKECTSILCAPGLGSCSNGATNARQPIAISGVNSTYNYRYSCACGP